jgi:hypothetical protein
MKLGHDVKGIWFMAAEQFLAQFEAELESCQKAEGKAYIMGNSGYKDYYAEQE